MLSTSATPGRLRLASNLLPTLDKTMATRPGALQVVEGDIQHAAAWDSRILFQKDGRIQLWDSTIHDIAPAGRVLDAAAFQALTADAQREDRLYVADGLNPLWYLVRTASSYQKTLITNSIVDEAAIPYPLPNAESVAVWRNRLWTSDGSNRVTYCENETPDAWDPLFTLEFQSGLRSAVRSTEGTKNALIVGTERSIWAVTGDSQYNWQRDQVSKHHGTPSPLGIATDGERLFYASATGIRQLGAAQALSDADLREAFTTPDYSAKLALHPDGIHLYCLVHSRLFVLNTHTGLWGEIAGTIYGVFATVDNVGWYGPDGLWLQGGMDAPDVYLDGREVPVESVYETWPSFPNKRGRTLLARAWFEIKGSATASAAYTCTSDEQSAAETFTLADQVETWADLWDGSIINWPGEPVQREVVPMVSGRRFTHRLAAAGHLEITHLEAPFLGDS